MKKSALIFLLFLAGMAQIVAQQRPIGTWETYLPYGSATQVVNTPDRIYCATEYSLFYIEKSDGTVNTLTKSNGLSDADVRHIAYNSAMNTLVITYASSNIDLLVNGTDIYNIPDIKNAIISGSKNINDIAMIGSYAYLATDLGISVLDLQQQQIMSNYIIGSTGLSVVVNSIASDGVSLFAATAEGLKSAPLSSPNLQDYAVWTIYDTSSGLPAGATNLVGQIGGRFYAVILDTLFVDTNGHFTKLRYDTTWSYKSLCNTGGYLYGVQWGGAYLGRVLQIQANGIITPISLSGSPRPYQFANDGANNWVADNWKGLCKYDSFTFTQYMDPDGPPDNGVFRMTVSDRTLYMAAGGTDPAYLGYNGDFSGPVVYNHVQWQSYSPNNYSSIAGCLDLVDIAVDNVHKKAYWASLEGGLVELDLTNNNLTNYNAQNSILGACVCNGSYTKISALCLDPAGNLWMSNSGTTQSLVLKTVDSGWAKFAVPNDLYTVRKMIVDANGYVWMGGRTGNSNMIVYNPGQSLTSAADDQFLSLTTSTGNGALPNSDVWSIVSDNEGNVWVGTDVGIATFYCAASLFSTPGQVGCDATLIKVDQGGYIGYLFSTEIVQALAVDGADRKWVGTTNGLWLISADGTTQLLNFNASNSPLLNNSVNDIAIDQQSGEVWIGTQDGLLSYQGDAILGNTTKGTALVYPNPVKSDYTGPIAIKGLVENAYVKITDASGILVYQGAANGGQMIWNGEGYNGNKVSTGIYMVYADAADGSQHNVAKIVFIK
jgi:ligand-binding sensor domain-containing protein